MDDNTVDIQELLVKLQTTETSPRGFTDIFNLGVDHGFDLFNNQMLQSKKHPNELVPAEEEMIKYVNQYYTKIQNDYMGVIRCEFGKTSADNQQLLQELGIPFEARHIVSIQRLTHKQFRQNLCACVYTKHNDSKKIANIWLNQPAGKRDAKFIPYGIKRPDNEADFFNLFPGLQAVLDLQSKPHSYDPGNIETEHVRTIKDHLAYLCGGADTEATFEDGTQVFAVEYLLDWLAYSIQTGKKTNILLVLTGHSGCGKGIFVEQLMKKIYGDHAHQVMQPSAIRSGVNSDFAQKMFINLNEASVNGFTECLKQMLKSLVDGDAIRTGTRAGSAKVMKTLYANIAFTWFTFTSIHTKSREFLRSKESPRGN